MAAGGFCKLPNGTVVVALNLPRPLAAGSGSVRVLVHAQNRARALTRLRNLGMRAVYLRGNGEPRPRTRSPRSCTIPTASYGARHPVQTPARPSSGTRSGR